MGAVMADDGVLRMAGEAVRFVETTEMTGGRYLVAEVTMQPGARGPLPHIHPVQEERFEIVTGRAALRVGRKRHELSAGETAVVPPGSAHGVSNPYDEPLTVRTTWTPAGDLEHFFENLFGVGMTGPVNRQGIPPLRQIALISRAHPLSGPPAIPSVIRRPLMWALATLGRWSGMKGSYLDHCPHQPER